MPIHPEALEINDWLIGDARRCGDAIQVVEGYLQRLCAAGLPVRRARIAQRLANPLLAAWGMIWTPSGVEEYTVRRTVLETGSWHGSPFEYVLTNNRPLHKSLRGLGSHDHQTYHELAESGGTDFYVTILEYGDGSRQGCSYLTDRVSGFTDDDLNIIENTRAGLASALEPIAMRRSTASLLKAYLGSGPAQAVVEGTIERGQHVQTTAAIMFADLRGFTAKSVAWSEDELLSALDDYFEAVVEAVHKNSGDVLKLLGDGILAIFRDDDTPQLGCHNAVSAAIDATTGLALKNRSRSEYGAEPISAGFGLSFGSVTYGNIGSPDRLDFTVVGAAVNRASRIQDLCKASGCSILMEAEVADRLNTSVASIGQHTLKGLPGKYEIYAAEHVSTA